MEPVYRVGTRRSPLAFKQTGEVLDKLRRYYPSLRLRIVGIDTCGDKDTKTPISKIEGSDFFTREIDKALMEGRIDFAVHSAKDLPDITRDGLTVAAVTESVDPRDALVSKYNLRLNELPLRATIGTSSRRRQEGLRKYRSDFRIIDIRGNIGKRLQELYVNDHLQAIIIAVAGLLRLKLAHKITQKVPLDILAPHPLQGRLALVAGKDNKKLVKLLSTIDSRESVRV